MATSETPAASARLARAGRRLLAGRPLVALVAVWLTAGGHTMNLREMGVSQGWVAAEVYALQGSLPAAIEQLQLARTAGDGDFYQLSVVDARLKELRAQHAAELRDKR